MPIGGRGGGFIGSSTSTRVYSSTASSSPDLEPTRGATHCHRREYQKYAPLQDSHHAQEWCHYRWPQPTVTETCTVNKEHPKPTTIWPPKPQKPRPGCPNRSYLCRLYESLKEVDRWGDHGFTSNVCFCIETRPTVTVIVPGPTHTTTIHSTTAHPSTLQSHSPALSLQSSSSTPTSGVRAPSSTASFGSRASTSPCPKTQSTTHSLSSIRSSAPEKSSSWTKVSSTHQPSTSNQKSSTSCSAAQSSRGSAIPSSVSSSSIFSSNHSNSLPSATVSSQLSQTGQAGTSTYSSTRSPSSVYISTPTLSNSVTSSASTSADSFSTTASSVLPSSSVPASFTLSSGSASSTISSSTIVSSAVASSTIASSTIPSSTMPSLTMASSTIPSSSILSSTIATSTIASSTMQSSTILSLTIPSLTVFSTISSVSTNASPVLTSSYVSASGCTLAVPTPTGRICGETGIYTGESTDKLIEVGSAADKETCATSCSSTIGCVSFGFSAPSTGGLGVCNLYKGYVTQLQINIVNVAPVGGQALQTFYDIACFNCPPVATQTPPLLPVRVTSASGSSTASTAPSTISPSTLSSSTFMPQSLSSSTPVTPPTPVCTFENAILQLDATAYGFAGDYAMSNANNDYTAVDFGSQDSASQYSLDANGRLTIVNSSGRVKIANVPEGAINTDLEFDAAEDVGTVSTCVFINDELTCVTGDNTILYVCIGAPGLMTGPTLPLPNYSTLPPRVCNVATFQVQSPDGSPMNACSGDSQRR